MVCDLMVKPVTEQALREDTSQAEMIRMQVGGDAFNVASNLAALGVETALYSAVGRDAFGDFALAYAEKLGVPAQWIQKTDRPLPLQRADPSRWGTKFCGAERGKPAASRGGNQHEIIKSL